MQVFFDLGGGDFRCSGQIDHVAVGLQEVKLTGPVISHHKGVYVVFFDIGYFLLPVLLWDHQVHIADGFQHGFALFVGEVAFFLLFLPVELVRGQAHNQVIPQGLGPAEQVDVTLVEQIEGSVGDDAFHGVFSFLPRWAKIQSAQRAEAWPSSQK